jgi:aminopeptidase N
MPKAGRPLLAAAIVLALLPAAAPAEEAAPPAAPFVLSHEVAVDLFPDTGRLAAVDRMAVRRSGEAARLLLDLRADLRVLSVKVDGRPEDPVAREEKAPRPGIARYHVPIPRGPGQTGVVEVAWEGVLLEDPSRAKDLAFVVGDSSGGTVSPAGVYLGEGTGWLPSDGSMTPFTVTATVPEGWTVVTQGGVPSAATKDGRTTFTCPAGIPCDGLWLQAGRWKVERRSTKDGVLVSTCLSEANAGHSKLLLDSVEADLAQYVRLLGPYPHPKFDVVENFFSTGYGMPSATLLGGDVIAQIGAAAARSGGKVPPGYLDHELVHGWWGNGVFVDYDRGNWCEALTTYCTNYLRKEWESPAEAAKHRRGTRARFAARVRPDRDYPLRKFTGKTEDFENDIGYGKGSMLFHMARRAAGDEAFFGGLRDFATAFTGKRASWDDVRAAIEKRSGRNLRDLFDAALDSVGAPVAVLKDCTAAASGDGWSVTGRIACGGAAGPLSLPVVVETTAGSETTTVDVTGTEAGFSVRTRSLPVRVLLDPESHVWRGYAPGEVPATLDATLHSTGGVACLPPLRDDEKVALEPLFAALRGRPGVTVIDHKGPKDQAPASGPTTGSLGLGLSNGMMPLLVDHPDLPFRLTEHGCSVGNQTFRGDDIAVLASFKTDPGKHGPRSMTVYFGLSPAAYTAARRVFFYGGDGVVVFKAGRPVLRLEAEGDESSRAALLESAFPEPEAARIRSFVDDLCKAGPAGDLAGRLAGSRSGAIAEAGIGQTLAADGFPGVRSQPFSFEVADWDGSPCLGIESGPADVRGVPFCFSPADPEWRTPAPLLVAADVKVETFLASLQETLEKGAAAVLVLGPPVPPPALADYLRHPSALSPEEREKLRGVPADLHVEGARARLLLPGFEVKVPVVYFGKEPETSWLPTRVRSPVTRRKIETTNLLALIPGSDPALAGEAVLLGAHHDHLGPGFPGGNDNASGVAALREAGRALLARKGALRRPVILAFFGAEEWGLRGSAHFTANSPEGFPKVVAVLNLDTVGQAGVGEVHVVGGSVYPGLGRLAARCVEGAGLRVGRDIDKFAFAWGSDHYSFHRAGIPAVDFFSAEYRIMHTPSDTADTVDPGKTVRVARAAAAFALSVSREGPPK